LDPEVAADTFASVRAAGATPIKFARPDLPLSPGAKPPAKGKQSKSK
jgi:hypothetical protein